MVDFDRYRDANLAAFELTGGAAANGLTVRDYFAAKSMMALMGEGRMVIKDIAGKAYLMADAMMKERNKPAPKPASTVEEAFGLDK